jgi:hypothetical protein
MPSWASRREIGVSTTYSEGDERKLSPEQEAEILDLCIWAETNHAQDGLDMDLDEIADSLGWSVNTLNRVKRMIREHPELGITFAVKRGRTRKVVVAFDAHRLTNVESMLAVEKMSDGERRENFRRILNSSGTIITAYMTAKPRNRTEARRLRQEAWMADDFVRSIRRHAERYDDEKMVEHAEAILDVSSRLLVRNGPTEE